MLFRSDALEYEVGIHGDDFGAEVFLESLHSLAKVLSDKFEAKSWLSWGLATTRSAHAATGRQAATAAVLYLAAKVPLACMSSAQALTASRTPPSADVLASPAAAAGPCGAPPLATGAPA